MRKPASIALAATTLALAWTAPAAAEEPCPHHAQPRAAAPAGRQPSRTVDRYDVPAVTLLDQEGRAVALRELLAPGAPVAVNFIFTTCTTVCPVMSASFAGLSARTAGDAGLKLVSITIDPENDRPAALAAYARRFRVGPRWTLLTGAAKDVRQVIDAFDALRGDKTGHRPLTLVRRAGEDRWTRVDGLASAEELAAELRPVHAHR